MVLLRLGFYERWNSWIMQCVTSVSYSLLFTDSVHGHDCPSRGIHQGDLLSPYIFIVCGEVLLGLCCIAQESGHMSGLQVARELPQIYHLLFADDTIFFVQTDSKSCTSTLMDILHKYEISSGQMIKQVQIFHLLLIKNPTRDRGTCSFLTRDHERRCRGKVLRSS